MSNVFWPNLEMCLENIALKLDLRTTTTHTRHDYHIPAVLYVDYQEPHGVNVEYESYLRQNGRQLLPPRAYVRPLDRATQMCMPAAIARCILVDMSVAGYSTDGIFDAADEHWCTPTKNIDRDTVSFQYDLALSIGNSSRISDYFCSDRVLPPYHMI